MLLLVWIVRPGFDGCPPGGWWCLSMYWITESGGWIGSSVIVLGISIGFAMIPLHPRAKAVMFLRTLLVLAMVLGGFAKFNEHFIKSRFAVSRPSHLFIIREGRSVITLDSIYRHVIDERRQFFKDIIDNDSVHFKKIDPKIIAHWIYEAGYSMPSGHAFNAFLLASMLSFCLFELNERRITIWLYAPMLWAALVGMSRVVLGVHTPLDVTVGGALGILVSHGLLSVPVLNGLFVPARTGHTASGARK